MPMTPEQKKQYQRDYMAKRRQQAKGETVIPEGKYRKFSEIRRSTPKADSEAFLGAGYDPAKGQLDPSHEHYWRRRLGEDFATCIEFEMQGRVIGGCGEQRKYEGKLLSTRVDGGPDLGVAITDNPVAAKQIYAKMPVTKSRER